MCRSAIRSPSTATFSTLTVMAVPRSMNGATVSGHDEIVDHPVHLDGICNDQGDQIMFIVVELGSLPERKCESVDPGQRRAKFHARDRQ